MTWVVSALLGALFAALTAILTKKGVQNVDTNVATAVRTVVSVLFAWGVVAAQGHLGDVARIERRTMVYLLLSGGASVTSWLFYFHALKFGPASSVQPIDKLSLPVTVILAALLLRERPGPYVWAGVALMVAGALITLKK